MPDEYRDRFAEAFVPPESSQQRAVKIARAVLSGHPVHLEPQDYVLLAAEYLRSLALPHVA